MPVENKQNMPSHQLLKIEKQIYNISGFLFFSVFGIGKNRENRNNFSVADGKRYFIFRPLIQRFSYYEVTNAAIHDLNLVPFPLRFTTRLSGITNVIQIPSKEKTMTGPHIMELHLVCHKFPALYSIFVQNHGKTASSRIKFR